MCTSAAVALYMSGCSTSAAGADTRSTGTGGAASGSSSASGAGGSGGDAGGPSSSSSIGGAPSSSSSGGSSSSSSSVGVGGDTTCTPNASEPCYEGPVGTQAIGACKAGTHVCNPRGT